ncbi:MAG: hypothetical protein WCY21_03170 [Candidatus Cloacimonadaceae bacterium]|jgi:hypothetical protein
MLHYFSISCPLIWGRGREKEGGIDTLIKVIKAGKKTSYCMAMGYIQFWALFCLKRGCELMKIDGIDELGGLGLGAGGRSLGGRKDIVPDESGTYDRMNPVLRRVHRWRSE